MTTATPTAGKITPAYVAPILDILTAMRKGATALRATDGTWTLDTGSTILPLDARLMDELADAMLICPTAYLDTVPHDLTMRGREAQEAGIGTYPDEAATRVTYAYVVRALRLR